MREDHDPEHPNLAVAAAAIGGLSLLVLAVASAPRDPHLAAGVFPPWWTQGTILSAAARAGAVEAVGRAPFIVIVRDPAGNASARLRAAGAVVALDPRGLAGCRAKEA